MEISSSPNSLRLLPLLLLGPGHVFSSNHITCFSFIYASFKHTVCYHDHVYTTMYIQNTASYKFMFLLCPGAFIIHLIFIHVLFMPLYGMTMERDENKGKERETVDLKGCSYLA